MEILVCIKQVPDDSVEISLDEATGKPALDGVTPVVNAFDTYAEEIKMPFYGEGLDGLLRARSNCLSGIVNGIDYDEYNPETDENIAKNYSVANFRKEKVKNKVALQKELGLEVDPKKMMIGLVSRLTDQKGLDLVAYIMDFVQMQFSLLFLEQVKTVTKICSDILIGNTDSQFQQIFTILKQCLIKYTQHVMRSLCLHYLNHVD